MNLATASFVSLADATDPTQLEKLAVWGTVLRAGKGLYSLGGSALKGLWNAGGAASRAIAEPVGALGNSAVRRAATHYGWSPNTVNTIQGLGKGMASEAATGALLGGGLNAALADPGERTKAFFQGAATGALGGVAYAGGRNLAATGLSKAMPKRFAQLQETAKPGFFGQLPEGAPRFSTRLKSMGAKTLTGGVPFAAGTAAAMAMPIFGDDGSSTMPPAPQHYAPYAARFGAGMINQQRNNNPNLPFPQVGY